MSPDRRGAIRFDLGPGLGHCAVIAFLVLTYLLAVRELQILVAGPRLVMGAGFLISTPRSPKPAHEPQPSPRIAASLSRPVIAD